MTEWQKALKEVVSNWEWNWKYHRNDVEKIKDIHPVLYNAINQYEMWKMMIDSICNGLYYDLYKE